MGRIIYIPEDFAELFSTDPAGEWMLEHEMPDQWLEALEAIDQLKSAAVRNLIEKTIDGTYQWKFEWVWFTGGMWIPMWINQHGDRMQIAWPPKEWGYIVVVNFHDGTLYDSALDDENYVQVGMELLHLAEDHCANHEYMVNELTKRADAHARGETYPPVEKEAAEKWIEDGNRT